MHLVLPGKGWKAVVIAAGDRVAQRWRLVLTTMRGWVVDGSSEGKKRRRRWEGKEGRKRARKDGSADLA